MHWVQKAALVYLVALGVAAWGYGVGAHRWWPYSTLREIREFAKGDPEEGKKSFIEKLENDFGGTPHRKLVAYEARQAHPKREYRTVKLPHKKSRRQDPLLYLTPKATPALRLVYGSFDHQDHINGAILLSQRGEVIWEWTLHEDNVTWKQGATEDRKFPHGLIAHQDGSLTFSFDNGVSLQRFDRCSRSLWMTQVRVDHSLNYSPIRNRIWGVISPSKLGVFDDKTGKLRELKQMKAWPELNPHIDPLGLRQIDYDTKSRWSIRGGGYWHPNDAEPLPTAYASAFPQFKPGDLLISFRSINLIFVASPKGEIKWWRIGPWRRQHDPDWQPDGTITVFNNNMHRGVSSIVKIDPKTYQHEVVFDGKKEGFYTWMRGKHQMLKNNHIAISSPQQGRVFEVDESGEVVFEFVNRYDDKRTLIVSELLTLPLDYFGENLKPCDAPREPESN